MPICHKCKQQKQDTEVRTYNLVLKNNVRNSFLAGLDKINLCFACDGARKTSIVRYLEQ
jgi:hypothetical protein